MSVEVRAIRKVVLWELLVAVEVDADPVRQLVRVTGLVLPPSDALHSRRFGARPRPKAPSVLVQVRIREAEARDRVPHADVIVARAVQRNATAQTEEVERLAEVIHRLAAGHARRHQAGADGEDAVRRDQHRVTPWVRLGRLVWQHPNPEEAPAIATAVDTLLEHAVRRQHAGAQAEARAGEARVAGRIVATEAVVEELDSPARRRLPVDAEQAARVLKPLFARLNVGELLIVEDGRGRPVPVIGHVLEKGGRHTRRHVAGRMRVRRRRRRRRIVEVTVEQPGREGEVAAGLALVAIRRVTARLAGAALGQVAHLGMRVEAPAGIARLAVSLACGHVGRIPRDLAAVVAREQRVRRGSAPVATVARSRAVCVAIGHGGGRGGALASAGVERGGQEHRQPLRRAGNAADERSRFRAGLARGVRVVGLVHDDCFCRIATNIAVLIDGPGAGTKVDDLRQLARHAGLRQQAAQGCRVGWSGFEDVCRLATKPGSDGRQAPLSTTSGGGPVLAVALSPKKQAAQCPTCCAQPGRREWREDCAGSGDSDEDEGAEALAGFFLLVVEM
eukprot:scaffold20972_cov58-Phaeocystis_antarctica.AAC.4